MQFSLEFIEQFTDNLGKILGPKCEIVVHDFSGDLEHTIVHIVNGENTGRKVGDAPTNLFFEHLQAIKEHKKTEQFSEYYTFTEDGRTIHSSSTFLADENGDTVGAICVNYDISELLRMNSALGAMIGSGMDKGVVKEKFARNVQELMDHYLLEVVQEIGKPGSQMDRAEKLRALAYLDGKGITLISKAHVKLCEFFNVSKYTLYNYLDEVRKKGAE